MFSKSALDQFSSAINSLPGALAILGALGSDTMGPVMLLQCLSAQLYHAIMHLSQILDGACQPMVGLTFKLGSMLTVHTACVLAGRINAWDACAGFAPLRDNQAQCYMMDGGFKKQMGSYVYVGIKDHVTAIVYVLKSEKIAHCYIKMSINQNFAHLSRWSCVRIVGASWPLVVVIVMLVLEEWPWVGIRNSYQYP